MEGLKISLIKCLICGKDLKYISNTHLKKHNLTIKDYQKLYPEAKIRCDEYDEILLKICKTTPEKMRAGVVKAEKADPEYHKKRIINTNKTIKEKRKNDKNYDERYRNKRKNTQLNRWKSASKNEIDEFKKKMSKITKERFQHWKCYEPEKLENFKKIVSEASKKMWNKKTPEEKRKIYSKYNQNSQYEYNGIKYKNWFEQFVAEELSKYNISFEYQSLAILLSNKKTYIPDFYIKDKNLIIEAKGRTTEKSYISYMKQKESKLQGYNHEFIWYERDSNLIKEQIKNILYNYNII